MNLEIILSQNFTTSKLLVKKELFTIFVNWFQTALETLLWHIIIIMWCCGYVTCSSWSRKHVENIFRSIMCIKTFCGRKTWKDGSFCNLILTPKGVCRYQKCSKNCWFSWFFELFQAVKCFEGKYRPSNSIVILPYILKTSQKNFGVVTMKTLRGRRKKRTPPLKVDFWNPSL